MSPPNYIPSRVDRQDVSAGGRVLILVAAHHGQREGRQHNTPNVQAVEVIVQIEQHRLSVIGVYRSPSATIEVNQILLEMLTEQAESSDRTLLVGDFNAPEIDLSTETAPLGTFGERLLEMLHRRALIQHVTGEIRWRFRQTASTLDLVCTKFPNEVRGTVVEDPLGKATTEL
ncbi:unnamed protein product [Echinostoma caproni]|uniref:Endo/exonuclease/phosphatase domain-containing protein n=1 Tax=Echinostoma caproni TaxID=27848 RepID=A0A183B632_9TREM|nr:unnamed protein product [Echinostoma caproni]